MYRGLLLALVCVAVMTAGCATTGQDQVANSVYATHRIVKEMHSDLAPRVSQLNQTSADLGARVEALDVGMRTQQGKLDEQAVQLAALDKKLGEVLQTLYRLGNMSGAGTSLSRLGPDPGAAVVVPPSDTEGLAEVSDVALLNQETVSGSPTAMPSSNAVTDYNDALKVYLDNQDYELAVQKFGAFLERYPNNDFTNRALFWRGECNFRLKKYQEAVSDFQKLRADFPDSEKVPLSMLYEGLSYVSLGQKDTAIQVLEELVQKYPIAPSASRAKAALRNLKEE